IAMTLSRRERVTVGRKRGANNGSRFSMVSGEVVVAMVVSLIGCEWMGESRDQADANAAVALVMSSRISSSDREVSLISTIRS
ncbi:MAG: hypothetical protein JWN99_3355, partial [Ilumatobacteraceae bacterium]|nr:hypothetical protein [Ilumatobacteraceae bacterium]